MAVAVAARWEVAGAAEVAEAPSVTAVRRRHHPRRRSKPSGKFFYAFSMHFRQSVMRKSFLGVLELLVVLVHAHVLHDSPV